MESTEGEIVIVSSNNLAFVKESRVLFKPKAERLFEN